MFEKNVKNLSVENFSLWINKQIEENLPLQLKELTWKTIGKTMTMGKIVFPLCSSIFLWCCLVVRIRLPMQEMQETWVQFLGWEDGEGNGKLLQYSCLENSMDKSLVG